MARTVFEDPVREFSERISLPHGLCIALKDCLDLAIRKGKAVGETKPTETPRAIFRISVSGPESPDSPAPRSPKAAYSCQHLPIPA